MPDQRPVAAFAAESRHLLRPDPARRTLDINRFRSASDMGHAEIASERSGHSTTDCLFVALHRLINTSAIAGVSTSPPFACGTSARGGEMHCGLSQLGKVANPEVAEHAYPTDRTMRRRPATWLTDCAKGQAVELASDGWDGLYRATLEVLTFLIIDRINAPGLDGISVTRAGARRRRLVSGRSSPP